MANLNPSNDATNKGPGRVDINQGDFRTQQNVIGDSLLQPGGRGEVQPGTGTVNDPLNAPFVLYVNPYTGRDDFAFGSYAEKDDDTVDQELRRIESQRLECGYSEAAPFRTLNRACIEAGLITSKSYFSYTSTDSNYIIPFQRVCIVLAPGVYDLLCGPGKANGDITAWSSNANVDDNFLRQFNPATVNPTTGGIILPRGTSLVSLDLRKTILRPEEDAVPAPADEAANYSNRAAILRVSGESYCYGVTFMDCPTKTTSHHLLSCYEFAYRGQLNEFYQKLNTAFSAVLGAGNLNVSSAALAARDTEWQIVGPQGTPGSQTTATDTTKGASPYIYNSSVRSELGLCGAFFNGDPNFGGANNGIGGFRSIVCAQFTGVSLQTDYTTQSGGTTWQKYNTVSDVWENITDFATYRDTPPDDVRMNPARRSFHIRAVEGSVIQIVSVFAIGQGAQLWVESGGEITATNGNANFGGCAAIAEGFQSATYPQDNDYALLSVKRPTDLRDKTRNIRDIFIGVTDSTMTVGSGFINTLTDRRS